MSRSRINNSRLIDTRWSEPSVGAGGYGGGLGWGDGPGLWGAAGTLLLKGDASGDPELQGDCENSPLAPSHPPSPHMTESFAFLAFLFKNKKNQNLEGGELFGGGGAERRSRRKKYKTRNLSRF